MLKIIKGELCKYEHEDYVPLVRLLPHVLLATAKAALYAAGLYAGGRLLTRDATKIRLALDNAGLTAESQSHDAERHDTASL